MSSFDVSNSVANSSDTFCLVIGDCDAEFLFELHDELYSVKAVSAKIGGECSGGSYLIFIYAQFVNDDCFYTRCDF